MIDAQHLRMTEALLFAAEEPLDEATLAARLPDGADLPALLAALAERYAGAGVNLTKIGGKWQLRTAPDLHYLLEQHQQQSRKLSRAALETLAIIAYHQPITRAEIEEVRGVGLSRGTLDILLEIGWVRPRGRRRVPGRPVTYGTADAFLEHFGLEDLKALPGLDELKAAGLLQGDPPPLQLATAPEDPDDDGEDAADDAPERKGTLVGMDGVEISGDRSGAD
jgi:segregation and condensation protein B